jgi:WD40 repeat protein
VDVPKLLVGQQLLVITPQAEITVRDTRCVVSAPDAASTAIETSQGQVSVLRSADGRKTEVPAGHFAVAFHQDRELTVRPVEQLPTKPHAELALEQARVIAFRGQQAIVAASSTQLGVFDRTSNEPLHSSALSKDASQHLITSAENGLVGQIDRSGVVQIFDPQTGSAVTTLETGIRNTQSAALNKSGDLLAISDRRSGWYSAARIWDLTSPTELAAIEVTGGIRTLALSQDGNQVALSMERARGFDYPRLEIWNVSPPALMHQIPLADRPLRVLVFSPDGLKLAGANDRGNATIWDMKSGAELQQRGSVEGWTQPLTEQCRC